jgi:hypothetical protein
LKEMKVADNFNLKENSSLRASIRYCVPRSAALTHSVNHCYELKL